VSPEKAQLWLPVIPALRQRALLELHRAAAPAWSQGLRRRLRRGDRVNFEGFSFESCARLAAAQTAGGIVTLFAVESTRIAGAMIVNAPLAAYFAGRYPVDAAAERDSAGVPALTQLETALALHALDEVLQQVKQLYAGAQVGPVKKVGSGPLSETPLFSPDDYLAVFRYAIGDAESSLSLTVAANAELIGAIHVESERSHGPTSSLHVARLAATAPLRAAIVLGGWRVSIGELAALKPGDELVLPDGADAWLETAGLRVRRLRVEVAGAALRAYPVARSSAQDALEGR
jgi:hypothetical protein